MRSALLVVLVVVAAAVLLAMSWTPWQEPGLEGVTLASSRVPVEIVRARERQTVRATLAEAAPG